MTGKPPSIDAAEYVDIVCEAPRNGLEQKALAILGRRLPGSIKVAARGGMLAITYEDPSGTAPRSDPPDPSSARCSPWRRECAAWNRAGYS